MSTPCFYAVFGGRYVALLVAVIPLAALDPSLRCQVILDFEIVEGHVRGLFFSTAIISEQPACMPRQMTAATAGLFYK
jgi:hypothetical protein